MLHLIFTLRSDYFKLFWCNLYGDQSVQRIQRGLLYQNAPHGRYVDFPFDPQCLSVFWKCDRNSQEKKEKERWGVFV
jgi:hypothetical protein